MKIRRMMQVRLRPAYNWTAGPQRPWREQKTEGNDLLLDEKPDDLYEETGDESDEEKMYELADLFKIFGDSTRLRILTLLAKGQKCVSAISEELSMTQSAVSHQLRILRQSKLVKGCRSGRNIEYALADDHVKTIISQGLEHIEE